MRDTTRQSLAHYGAAILLPAAATGARLALTPWLKHSSPLLFLTPAVMFCAWYGGIGPGLLCTILGTVLADQVLMPDIEHYRLIMFGLIGAQISWLGGKLYSAKHRAELDAQAARQGEERYRVLASSLEKRVLERTEELGRLQRELLEVSEREQRRIGQDLHDGLGQHLTGISLMCKSLAIKLHDPAQAQEAARIAEFVAQAIGQARDLARGLRPLALAEEGLPGALRQVAATAQGTAGIPCELVLAGDWKGVEQTIESHLYRIAQEAVTNAVRHAKAQRIRITLASETDSRQLRVEDDGVGMTARPAGPGGMGLQIMRHRASMIGATLDIRPRLQGGTIVICSLSTNHPQSNAQPSTHPADR